MFRLVKSLLLTRRGLFHLQRRDFCSEGACSSSRSETFAQAGFVPLAEARLLLSWGLFRLPMHELAQSWRYSICRCMNLTKVDAIPVETARFCPGRAMYKRNSPAVHKSLLCTLCKSKCFAKSCKIRLDFA